MICEVIGLPRNRMRPAQTDRGAECALRCPDMPGTSLQKAVREGVSQKFLPHIHGRCRNRRQFYEREVEIVLGGLIRQVRSWTRHLRMDRVTEGSKFSA